MVRRLVVCAAGCALTMSVVSHTQSGTTRIAGRAVDATSGTPLSSVVVTLNGRGAPPARQLLGSDGQFVFDDLPASSYSLAASRPGYFPTTFDQQQPMGLGRPIDLTAPDRRDDVVLRLWKQNVIDGTIVDEKNIAMAGIDIHALRRSLVGGHWMLVDVATTMSDDRGHYRLVGLTPGAYIVAALPPSDPETSVLMTLLGSDATAAGDIVAGFMSTESGGPEIDARVRRYPIVHVPDSTTAKTTKTDDAIVLAPGAERDGVAIRLRPARGVRISGGLLGAGAATGAVTIRLVPADAIEGDVPTATTTAIDDGRFQFSGIPPGRYIAHAVRLPPTSPANAPLPDRDAVRWGDAPVMVNASDLGGISIPLHPGSVLSGYAVFDPSASAPSGTALTNVTLRLEPADGPIAGAPVWRGAMRADGRIEWMAVPAGRYFVRVGAAPPGWTVASAMVDGHDALDEPVDLSADSDALILTFARQPFGSVGGTVHDSPAGSAATSTVYIFPADRALRFDTSPASRRAKVVRPVTNGSYSVGALPPGDYCIIARPGEPPIDWQDPARLDALASSATRVHVTAAARAAIDLSVAGDR